MLYVGISRKKVKRKRGFNLDVLHHWDNNWIKLIQLVEKHIPSDLIFFLLHRGKEIEKKEGTGRKKKQEIGE